jgi:hypothetical protein
MKTFTSIGVLPEDHQMFKQLALKKDMKLYDLFHEWVEREMKNDRS